MAGDLLLYNLVLIIAHAHAVVNDLVDVIVNRPNRTVAKDKLATHSMSASKQSRAMEAWAIATRSECKLRCVKPRNNGCPGRIP